MKVHIYSNDFELTEAMRNFIDNKLQTTFSRLHHVIQHVDIRMADENGPKGGPDKSCIICIKTNEFPDIIIKDIETDAYAAISRAISRAKRTLARRLKLSRVIGKRTKPEYYSLEA